MNPIQLDLIDTMVHEHQETLRRQASKRDLPRVEPRWRQRLGDYLIETGERISGHQREQRVIPARSFRVS